jgi:hypothetical protein
MVALHLLKWVHGEQDGKGRDVELRYFRAIHHGPIKMIVLGFFFYRADARGAEGRKAHDRVKSLQDADPPGEGRVTDLQVFPKTVDRKRERSQLLRSARSKQQRAYQQ